MQDTKRYGAGAAVVRVSARRHLLFAVLLLAVLAQGGRSAVAAEQKEKEAEANTLVTKIKGLRKAKDSAAMQSALTNLVTLHNLLSSKTVRHSLQHVAGQVLTDKKMGADRIAAAEALGKLNDPAGAFKHLKPALPSKKTEAAGPVELAALKAVGASAADRAIPTLLELMSKGKDNNVSKEAVVALGAFGTSKKRVTVVVEVVDFLRLLKPQRTPGKRVGAATRERWNTLQRPLINSLNRLTGQKVRSSDGWLELYKAHKKSPKKLFVGGD